MKTKATVVKGKSVIEQLRQIRDAINSDISNLTLEELKHYWKKKDTLHNARVWKQKK